MSIHRTNHLLRNKTITVSLLTIAHCSHFLPAVDAVSLEVRLFLEELVRRLMWEFETRSAVFYTNYMVELQHLKKFDDRPVRTLFAGEQNNPWITLRTLFKSISEIL